MVSPEWNIDKGFCPSYWRLSYRRKLIRTLWTGAFMAIVLIMLPEKAEIFFLSRNAFVVSVTALWAIQAGYNFYRWKKEKPSDSSPMAGKER